MIKGIGKRVVVLTDPTSKLYEQAIFILKQDTPATPCDKDMLSEAERIINAHVFSSARLAPRRNQKGWLPYLGISIAVSLLVGVSVLLFLLW